MNNLAKQNILPEVHLTEVGLTGLDGVDEATFFEIGVDLVRSEHGLQWAIGDWYNAIPAGKGNRYVEDEGKAKACLEVGLNPNTARECGRVARKFRTANRLAALTFKHHQQLAIDDLAQLQRTELLKLAVAGSPTKKGGESRMWSSTRLKEERDKLLGILPPEPIDGFTEKADALTEAVVSVLPKTAGRRAVNTTKAGIKKLAADMQHEFNNAVEKKVDEELKAQRQNLRDAEAKAKEEFERTINMKAGVKAFMNRDEFMLVRACLHPDKNSHPRAGEAFTIFNRLADVKSWEK